MPFPPPGDLPDTGTEPVSLKSPVLVGRFFMTSATWEAQIALCVLMHFSCVLFFVILWTVAFQDSPSMGFSRQEYWNALPFPPPQDLPDPRIKPTSLKSLALAGRFFTTSATWEVHPNCFRSHKECFAGRERSSFQPTMYSWHFMKIRVLHDRQLRDPVAKGQTAVKARFRV